MLSSSTSLPDRAARGEPSARLEPGWRRRVGRSIRWPKLVLPLLGLAVTGVGSACSQELSCTSRPVQEALHKAIDKTYAELRTYYQVAFTVDETITVRNSPNKAVCKAILTVTIKGLGENKRADGTANYTAERAESGNIIVSVYE